VARKFLDGICIWTVGYRAHRQSGSIEATAHVASAAYTWQYAARKGGLFPTLRSRQYGMRKTMHREPFQRMTHTFPYGEGTL